MINLTPSERDAIGVKLLAYADTDLLCYWAEDEALQSLQRAQWEPVLTALERHFGIYCERVVGIMPVRQPDATILRLQAYLAALPDAALFQMARLVPLVGSLLLALAWREGLIDADRLIALAHLDETYQEGRWGQDAEAQAARASKIREINQLLDSLPQ